MRYTHRFHAGDVIIRENDIGSSAYIIIDGRVDVTKEKEGKKIYLGYLTTGDIFGEMSIIDEKPRSASIQASEDTIIREIHRSEFLKLLQDDQEDVIKILSALFNRLRETNIQAVQTRTLTDRSSGLTELSFNRKTSIINLEVFLKGLTPTARNTLPKSPLPIKHFPFRIGRESDDPFAYNDLYIHDKLPFQVSENHVLLVIEKDNIVVFDRGSASGTEVDSRRIGGGLKDIGPVFLNKNGGIIKLGNELSPYRYQIIIRRKSSSD